MGDISVGDMVYGSDGKPVLVLATTEIHHKDRYRITLEADGRKTQVVASGDHKWATLVSRGRAKAELFASRASVKKVHFGAWHHLTQVFDTRALFSMTSRNMKFVIPGRIPRLERADHPWRAEFWVTDLLMSRGLCDDTGRPALRWVTHGTTQPDELTRVRESLAESGIHTLLHKRRHNASMTWTLSVCSPIAADLLPSENDRAVALNAALERQLDRYDPGPSGWEIVSVERIADGDVKCIQVNAFDHLFLCTEEGIPTHNSMIASVLACWWINTRPPGDAIVVSTAPTYAQVNKILWEEIRKHHATAQQRGFPMIGRVTQGDEWKSDSGQVLGFGRKPATGDRHAFHGIHRRYVLVVLDEACHDDQTEVMTEDGWKLFADLTGDERLLTMDQTTHEATYRKPQKIVKKPHTGPMYLYEAKGANFCVTPDHDMYFHGRSRNRDTAWRKTPMEELAGKTDKYMKKTISWTAPDQEKFELPEYASERKFFPARFVDMDDWMTFLGWYLSEGHLIKHRGQVYGIGISQQDDNVRQEIFDLAESLGFKPRNTGKQVHITDTQLGRHLAQFGDGCLVKRVPTYARMASARQIGMLLDSYLKGDGYWKQGQGIIYTSSPQMADDLQEMILKTGSPSVVRKRSLAGVESDFGTHIATSSVDGYVITRPREDSKIKFYPQNLKKIDYEGMVYCASVPPEAMLFTRRKGYTLWSGNCGVPEEIWTGVEAITTTEGCRILAIGNPDDRNTEFGKVYLKPEMADMWNRVSVPAASTPNFTGEPVPELLKDVLVSKLWCEQRLRAWGKDDPRYMSKVDAKFPEVSKSSLFPPAVISSAFDDVPMPGPHGTLRLGVDVARFGADQNVVVSYMNRTAKVEATWSGTDTTSSAHQVIRLAEELKEKFKASWVEIRVDAVGLGAGVVDTLNARLALLPEAWYSVYEMHGSASAPTDVGGSVHGYGNARAYWFDQLRQMLRNGSVKIMEHEQLKDDLAIIFYLFKNGKLYIMPKEEMRTKHGRSPDFADALAYATAPVASGPQIGDMYAESAHTMAEELEGFMDGDMMISPF